MECAFDVVFACDADIQSSIDQKLVGFGSMTLGYVTLGAAKCGGVCAGAQGRGRYAMPAS